MQFLYHENAGLKIIQLNSSEARHFKVKRLKNKEIAFSNLEDNILYKYSLLDEKKLTFSLISSSKNAPKTGVKLRLALAMIDPKEIEDALPFVNEMGLDELILVRTKYSQGNFKLDLKRIKRILINSCKQCGRQDLIKISVYEKLADFIKAYPEVIAIDFAGKKEMIKDTNLYFIGPEGGFDESELKLFGLLQGLNAKNILRSKSVLVGLCARLVSL